jgi:phenylpropionate dioxygenase-like ring-hydroxylating dioxygenase large terminal subunit
MDEAARANWARALTDDRAFAHEQARLRHVWTLLGTTRDVRNDADWFRATLGGRSVFVQRFGDTLRGFENRCAHRFFPLRTAEKGNGAVVCGFHQWRYDEEGRAVGIPNCREVFGATPGEMKARLTALDIATCGSLVFGRFPGAGAAASLREFLGEGFPILESICTMPERPHRFGDDIAANWRLLFQITLDDYHLVAIHHRKRYNMNSEMQYFRFGAHSAHFVGRDDTLASMAAMCRENRYRPAGYRIFNIFPNLAVSLFRAVPYWYCNVQQFVPLAAGRTQQRGWFFRTGLAADETALERLVRPVSEPIRARIVRYFIEKIGSEDHRACEKLQTVAHQIDAWPILGAQETRIEWHAEAYAQAVGAGPEASTGA